MANMKRETVDQIQIDLPDHVLTKARMRASAQGLTISEYMQSLVDKDVSSPWREPVPLEVNARWDKEIAEFDEQEKRNPRPSAKTADELINLLDEETALISDNEGN